MGVKTAEHEIDWDHVEAALNCHGHKPLPARFQMAPPLPARKAVQRDGFVYVIGATTGPVKIGFSTEPDRRLVKLQAGSPKLLRILAVAPGTKEDERALHGKFCKERLHGEWFTRAPEIEAEIARLKEMGE